MTQNQEPVEPKAVTGGKPVEAIDVPPRVDEAPEIVQPLPLGLAIAAHIVVGALLVLGVQCTPKPPVELVIQAVLLEEPVVGEKAVTVEKAEKPKPQPPKPQPPKPEPPKPQPPKPEPPKPEPPKVDPEKLRQEAEAAELKRKEEATRREQEQLLAKQQAEEKIRQAEEKAKLEAEAKARRDAEELARKAAEEEAKRQAADAEAKRKADEEAARLKAEADAKAKRDAEEKARREALAAQLAAEEAARMAAIRADSQKLWARALSEAIRRNWLRPPGNDDDFRCTLNLRLLPNGQVVPGSARIASSCGSPVLDDSVIKAVYKASPLPLPSEPTAFVPDLTIRFSPR